MGLISVKFQFELKNRPPVCLFVRQADFVFPSLLWLGTDAAGLYARYSFPFVIPACAGITRQEIFQN